VEPHNDDVAAAVRNFAKIHEIRNRSGSASWRVTITINKEQRKRQFRDHEDALAQQTAWDAEKMGNAAATRPKLTRLTKEQLEEAESCFGMLKGTGFTLSDAIRNLMKNPPTKRIEISFEDGYGQFLAAKKPYISERHYWNYESTARRFSGRLKSGTLIGDITSEQITSWLKSLDCGKKSWNTYRDTLGAIFAWFAAQPRGWVSGNGPVEEVDRFRKRHTLPGPPKRLSIACCCELMAYIESEKPHLVTFFVTTLLLGVRPEGEMTKLADAIDKDGIETYHRGDRLFISADVAKDGRDRFVPYPDNVKAWLRLYPLSSDSVRPGRRTEYAEIRRRFEIPHDGLRHTSVTACTVLHGLLAATKRHGNGSIIANDHYLAEMSREEAEAFYSILPAGLKLSSTSEAA
jgi:hypothetical protein